MHMKMQRSYVKLNKNYQVPTSSFPQQLFLNTKTNKNLFCIKNYHLYAVVRWILANWNLIFLFSMNKNKINIHFNLFRMVIIKTKNTIKRFVYI